MARPNRTILLAQSDPRQEEFWRAAFMSQGFNLVTLPRSESLAALASPAGRHRRTGDLLLVDLADLAAEDLRLPAFGRRMRRNRPDLKLVVTLASRIELSLPERRWALRHGAIDFFPAPSLAENATETLDRLTRLAAAVGAPEVDRNELQRYLRVLLSGSVAALGPGGDVMVELARRGIGLAEVARRIRGADGVPCMDRRYRLKTYPNCFVGHEAVDWLVQHYGLSRELAAAVGQGLLERGILYHVVKDHAFKDEELYYRFAGAASAMDELEIDALVEHMSGPDGVAIADRRYLGKEYPACFVGAEAVGWLAGKFGISREDAVTVGQRFVDLFLAHHVLDEHDFIDGHYFYRFHAAEVG